MVSRKSGTTQSVSLEKARIVILGAGPTGLGAANRLRELGYSNFVIYEKENHAGGLASSMTDQNGFTWDVGGHVQFSHYIYFDDLMDALLGEEWLRHQRESWIWILSRFVPYPFQNNIRFLPKAEMLECLKGLIRAASQTGGAAPANFEEWIRASFGEGIARIFLFPYNFKTWAYPPKDMAFQWVGERVAKVDLERIIVNILEERDDVSWGPNNTFRYPLRGGTGEIWRRLASRFSDGQLMYGKTISRLRTAEKKLVFGDGTTTSYDLLISTIPLDLLVAMSDLHALQGCAQNLRHSSIHIVGIGLKGSPPPHLKTKCWMYFPEDSSPFYRATVFSNYSPHNVPDIAKYWSLMLEVSESSAKPVDSDSVVESVISGLLATHLIESKAQIVDTWHYNPPYGYPTPTLGRDGILEAVLPGLAELQIFSRGRFGAWKYEVSNQDHSLMQGVELIDSLAGLREELTLWKPELANAPPKK